MAKVSKSIFIIIVAILPVIIVIGILRMSYAGAASSGTPFPYTQELMQMFSDMPDYGGRIYKHAQEVQKNYNLMDIGFKDSFANFKANLNIQITDLDTFFIAIKNFFIAFGQFLKEFFTAFGSFFKATGFIFVVLFDVVTTPIDFVVWLITGILTI